MKSITPLDIRIVNYFADKLNRYLVWKKKKSKALADSAWVNRFKKDDNIIHQLTETLKISLYKDSILSRFIFDGFERAEIDFLVNYLDEGDYFVDIGSNVGLFSLYASKSVGFDGMILAFEPASKTYKRLLENIELNEIRNIQPYQLGLSDIDEILELNVSVDGHEAWNTFVQTSDVKFLLKEKVQVKSFDNFLKENEIETKKIALVKLDVEGFEINVLKGSVNLLESRNAPTFLIEFTDENAFSAGNCCHELYKLMLQYGYSWFTYDEMRRKLIPEPMRLSYPYKNLIAVKNAADNKRISQFLIGK